MNPADVDNAADSLKRFAKKVDTGRNKAGEPSFLKVITTSGLSHRRNDGVVVAPVGTRWAHEFDPDSIDGYYQYFYYEFFTIMFIVIFTIVTTAAARRQT